ncbi:WcbI family polysaccharide biosynthesis putative acetyltransferase [Burkholderia sp. MR1-5-21]
MKISLVGICQVVGMAAYLRKQFPDAEVFSYHMQPTSDRGEVINHLAGSDLIISQILPDHGMEEFSKEALHGIAKHVVIIPPLVFSGFHPDMIIIPHRGAPLNSPIEVYHSRIIAAAYTLGLPDTQAANIANSLVFDRLGYFHHFNAAKDVFFELLRPYQLEEFARSRWDDWVARGVFMHTPNHPNISILGEFALHAVKTVGVEPDASIEGKVDDIFDDQHGCPVYPEIARHLGVKGELNFRTYKRASNSEAERYMDIHRFAKNAYQIYHSLERDEFLVDPSIRFARSVIRDLISDSRSSSLPAASHWRSRDQSKRMTDHANTIAPAV